VIIGKRILLILLSMLFIACSSVPDKNSVKRKGFAQTGKASFYAMKFQNKKTASGETFKQSEKTAAHKKLPLGTKVKVTNTKNGRSVVVKINDRGRFVKGRLIDLSKSAFNAIGNTKLGVINVKIEVINLG